MPRALKRRVQAWARRKEQLLPYGFSMTVVAGFDAMMVVVGSIAALQRPAAEWPIVVIAMVIAFSPEIVFFTFDLSGIADRNEGPTLWAAFMVGTAILLFASPTAITGDFAPLMLTLTVGMVSAITSARGGALAAASAAALLGVRGGHAPTEHPGAVSGFRRNRLARRLSHAHSARPAHQAGPDAGPAGPARGRR
ncbi:hypothetical protein [Mycobacterium genavense]|uniref:hypothetical protein n=1 Tax=Mycobacterium genavense TaxID=36812 RepID=UPI0004AF9008|nr:hypothetical protein [Mycobacterium genavense]